MSARIVDIVDAIVSVLNGESWTQAVAAERVWAPRLDPASLSTLAVLVAPTSRVREYQTRTDGDRLDYSIDLGIFKHIPGGTAARDSAVDDLVELVEAFESFWMLRELTVDAGVLTTTSSTTDPIFDADILRDDGVFASVISLELMEVRA